MARAKYLGARYFFADYFQEVPQVATNLITLLYLESDYWAPKYLKSIRNKISSSGGVPAPSPAPAPGVTPPIAPGYIGPSRPTIGRGGSGGAQGRPSGVSWSKNKKKWPTR